MEELDIFMEWVREYANNIYRDDPKDWVEEHQYLVQIFFDLNKKGVFTGKSQLRSDIARVLNGTM